MRIHHKSSVISLDLSYNEGKVTFSYYFTAFEINIYADVFVTYPEHMRMFSRNKYKIMDTIPELVRCGTNHIHICKDLILNIHTVVVNFEYKSIISYIKNDGRDLHI